MAASDDCNLQWDLNQTLTTSRADFADYRVHSHNVTVDRSEMEHEREFRFIGLRDSPKGVIPS
jgi:hypothetical protein